MKRGLRVGKLFGIDINLHYSWWFVFLLISWSLSTAFFPQFFAELSTTEHWVLGIIAALLLFVSVLLHELSHSLVARARRIKVESITLFFFGGVAGINHEDMRPMSEFLMAIAGPLFSLLLSGIFYLLYISDVQIYLTAISYYLFQLNLVLAIFNLVPGYPLDGGRAFRAIMYGYFKDIKRATRIAVRVGRFFALVLIAVGIYGLFTGAGQGLWLILLGGFLYFVGGMSYEQVVYKEILSKIKAKDLMTSLPTVTASAKLADVFKKYANSNDNIFHVKGKGLLNINELGKVDKTVLAKITAGQIAVPMSEIKTITLKDSLYQAYKLMHDQDVVGVRDGKSIAGFVLKERMTHRLMWELKFN